MRHIKFIRSILLIISAVLITSCSNNSAMKPEDFKNKEPRLIIEEYLTGNVKAWGVLQNRSGKVTRQFSADLNGSWDGKQLILKEKFNWDDGEIQNREWTINKLVSKNGLSVNSYISYADHYADTLAIWRNEFNKKWSLIKEQGFDLTFKRMWEFYLSYCEAGFKSKNIDLIQFSLQNK